MGERVRAILDTGVVIATDVEPLDGELVISAITLAELHFGVLVASTHRYALSVYAVCSRCNAPLMRYLSTRPSQQVTARSRRLSSMPGRTPRARSMDQLIAATAHAHSARLYTRNRDDFEGLADLVDVVAV